jgi:peroxiredoxin
VAKLEAGDDAPQCTLPDQDGRPVSLGDFAGQRVVVYVYPQTLTACGRNVPRDAVPFTADRALVVGDVVTRHEPIAA